MTTTTTQPAAMTAQQAWAIARDVNGATHPLFEQAEVSRHGQGFKVEAVTYRGAWAWFDSLAEYVEYVNSHGV